MFKNILVPLTGFGSDANALEAAFVLGHPFDANIEALHVQPEPIEIILSAALRQFGTKMSNQELVLSLREDALSRTRSAKESFDQFLERRLSTHAFGSAASGVTACWRELEGNPVQNTIDEARFNDLVVLARVMNHGEFSVDSIANILIGCGRPVLLMPNVEPGSLGHIVAIAWKETAEAARAVTAAMPMLARAKKILVLTAAEDDGDPQQSAQSAERLAGKLARHGLTVEAYGFSAPQRAGAGTLLRKAKELGAGLLVAGAYSHGRMRELVFGGFTRTVLDSCELPIFLLH
jgi:nucleotide-binding universal stress UspA family protein